MWGKGKSDREEETAKTFGKGGRDEFKSGSIGNRRKGKERDATMPCNESTEIVILAPIDMDQTFFFFYLSYFTSPFLLFSLPCWFRLGLYIGVKCPILKVMKSIKGYYQYIVFI